MSREPDLFGMARFRRVIADEAVAHVHRYVDFSAPDFQEVWRNYFSGGPGPTELRRNLSRDQQYFGQVRTYYSEIDRSFERIRDIQFYIRRFPFAGTRISRARNLRHNVECFFQEIYVLRERLKAFLPVLSKRFRHHPDHKRIVKALDTAGELVDAAFVDTVHVRGVHVHEYRFTNLDLDRLDTLDLLTTNGNDPFITAYYKHEYQRIRKEWAERIGDNVQRVEKILDTYFELLSTFMIHNDALKYPPAPRPGA